MRDGESTAQFINNLFEVDCSIDEAIEVEMHLFASLRREIAEQTARRVEAESRCDRLEAELSRYKQGVEVRWRWLAHMGVDWVEIPMPKQFIGHRVKVLVMKEDVCGQ